MNPPFTNVGVQGPPWCCAEDGEWVEWCGHLHDTVDDANECPWAPTQGLRCCIVELFDPAANLPCDPHGLHPAECLRCLSLRCIHLNDPDNCARCHELLQLQATDSPDAPEVEGLGAAGGAAADGRDSEGQGEEGSPEAA